MYFSTKPHGNMISHFLIFDFCLEWLALLWGPSWQEQACEWPEPCTWAGHRQGWPSKTPLKPFIGTCVDIQWVHGTCLDPVQESKTTWIVPLSTEKVELATAHATTRSFTWVDLWSPSWQEQACERPEPCTWAGLRLGWPSKTPINLFIGTCVDIQWVHGTCLDPVQESKTTWVVPLSRGEGRTGNGAHYDQELHLGGPVESLLAGAGLWTAWTMYMGWPRTWVTQ